MQNETESAVMSVNECAKILHLSRGSAYQGVLTGEIPHIKIGRRILIPRVAIQKLLESVAKKE
ncbi:helix-turn-helix domain-containing protein [Bacteroidota bacterium]